MYLKVHLHLTSWFSLSIIILYTSIYIAPLNSRGPTEALMVRLAPRRRHVLRSDKEVERLDDKKEAYTPIALGLFYCYNCFTDFVNTGYCCFSRTQLFVAGLPATHLNCLNPVLHSAARLTGRVSKFDHISAYVRDVLHWLPMWQRIEFKVAVLVWYSLIGQAHAYLTDLCRPSLSARSTRRLRSAEQGLLHVPFARTSIMQSRAFSVVGPLVWNGLPLALRHSLEYSPRNSFSTLKQHYSAVLGLGALLSSPTWRGAI